MTHEQAWGAARASRPMAESPMERPILPYIKRLAELVMSGVREDGQLLEGAPTLLTIQSAEYRHRAATNQQYITVAARAAHRPFAGCAWGGQEQLLSFEEQLTRDYTHGGADGEPYVRLFVSSHPEAYPQYPQRVGVQPSYLMSLTVRTTGVNLDMRYPEATDFTDTSFTMSPSSSRILELIDYAEQFIPTKVDNRDGSL